MTKSIKIDFARRIEWAERDDLENLTEAFDVAPGDCGRWYLWWRAEGVWVCSFPSEAAARRILDGSNWDGVSGMPGWDRGDPAFGGRPDVVGALRHYHKVNGTFPQIELGENSSLMDFLVPLGFVARDYLCSLIQDEIGHYAPRDLVDAFGPLVSKCLSGPHYNLQPELADHIGGVVALLLLQHAKWVENAKYGRVPAARDGDALMR
jgi:hypothetical protein